MKRLMKRWLAMVLVVLMVGGMLPTQALAARMETDERVETPVLDTDDPVADTQGRQDEEERPEPDPDDPDPLPVDPLWTIGTITVSSADGDSGQWAATVTTDTTGADSGNWALVFVPDVTRTGSTIQQLWNAGQLGDGQINSKEDFITKLTAPANTNIPGDLITAFGGDSIENSADASNFELSSDNTAVGLDKLPTIADVRTRLAAANITTFDGKGSIKYWVFFYSKTSTKQVIAANFEYRVAGLSDATYVLDLYDNSVKRVTSDGLEEDGQATYAGTAADGNNGSLVIPIHNDSTGTVYVSGNTTKYQKIDFASTPASGCGWRGSAIGARTVSPDAGGAAAVTLNFTYAAPEVGEVLVISVPYYEAEVDSEALPSNALPIGTANITVLVVNGSWAGEPLTFHVKVAADGTTTVAEGAQSVSAIGTFTDGIMIIPGVGGSYEIADESYGLVFNEGEAINSLMADVIFNDDGDGGTLPPDDPGYIDPNGTMLCGTADDNDGSTKSRGATISIDPDSITATLEDGKTYTVNISVTMPFDNAGELKDILTIPVNIIAEVESAVTYSVTYRNAANTFPSLGALLPSSTSGHAAGSSVTVSATPAANYEGTVSNLSYKFTGWTDQDGILHTPGSSFNITKNMTLTATWEAVMQSVTYKYNDGTPGTADKTVANAVQKGGTYTIGEADPTRTGWTFTGWTVTSGADSATGLKNGGSVTKVTGDVVLTAQWSQNTYHVTYSFGTVTPTGVNLPTQADVAEGGKFNVSAALAADGTVYTTAAGLGYTFTGWTVTGITGTTSAAPSDTLTMGTSDITLTAQWTAKNYTVTYVKGVVPAATIASNTATVQHGAKHTVKANGNDISGITTGWQFKSWDQTGQLTITDNTTITAQWQVKVSYALDGGTLSGYPADHWVTYNAVDGSFPADPTRTGWEFAGWQDGDGDPVTSATKFTKPTTVTAQWTHGKSAINYHWNYTGQPTWQRTGETGTNDTGTPTLST